jgi:hypothetical protein
MISFPPIPAGSLLGLLFDAEGEGNMFPPSETSGRLQTTRRYNQEDPPPQIPHIQQLDFEKINTFFFVQPVIAVVVRSIAN